MSLFEHLRPRAPVWIEADLLQLRHGAPKGLELVKARLARAPRSRRRRLWRLHDELVHRIERAARAGPDDAMA
jgi:hypothetical protein